jgi:hypothetical protein
MDADDRTEMLLLLLFARALARHMSFRETRGDGVEAYGAVTTWRPPLTLVADGRR